MVRSFIFRQTGFRMIRNTVWVHATILLFKSLFIRWGWKSFLAARAALVQELMALQVNTVQLKPKQNIGQLVYEISITPSVSTVYFVVRAQSIKL